jgi:flagellar hook-basal body complex protein FliE
MIPAISAIGSTLAQLAPTASAAPVTPTDGPTFDQMLTQAAKDAVGTLQEGEAAAIEGVKGSAPTFKVVDAVMSAQRTLQQVLAIRDKAVSAYQEITRMTI